VNERELRAAIALSGKKMQQVAAEIGIHRGTFYKKMTGRTNFTQKEIAALSKCLGLNSDQVMNIFFAA